MRNVSSVTWVVFIFLVSVAMEVASWLVSGFSGASAFRLFLLVALFALLLKGVRFVRYVLGVIYALSSVLAIGLAFQVRAHPGLAAVFLCGAAVSLASAVFFFRSRVLRGLAARNSNLPSENATGSMQAPRPDTVLLALAGVYFVGGVVLAFLPDTPSNERALSAALSVATMVAAYIWCKREAAARGVFPPGRSALWAAVFPPVFLPAYFVRTKVGGGAVRATGKALAYYVGLIVVMFGGVLLTAFARRV
jgi:hypothetical protein